MRAARSITIVAILALLWNLMGVASFVAQYRMVTPDLARTDPAMARIYAQMPFWVWGAFAISVLAGTAGSLLLLFRQAVAVPVYALSLIAIVLLFGQNFLATDLLAAQGWTAALFPAAIFLLAVAQFLYARRLTIKGVLR
ncbi:MAG: sugar transporter [Sphingobium sp.]|nr:sugar transporter [Sphingobium sp.]